MYSLPANTCYKQRLNMNNKRYIYYMLIICTLFLFSCNYRHKQEITIFYFCGNIEPYRQFD
ncbi:hypothetical protein DXC89_12225, partial [Prevotella disiens]